ncbi:uncharacterized protein LOC107606915 [Arachis ipaensis]|uniref:uncharacterized protein LOC107606915 n=1 Tax=Arachis ipaensis TaxID=130454 RepID=UPI0007AF3E85|nr:uncharacterized protein LOC107606915 [Arachis ipaensis]XP_025628242.1 uncharacterized protein LOC112721387 [Arachis hypogaea]
MQSYKTRHGNWFVFLRTEKQWAADGSFGFKNGSSLFVLVYVAHTIIIGDSNDAVFLVIQQLNVKFALKDMGELHYFLGIQVTKTIGGGLVLSQEKYAKDLLKKVDMENCKPCNTPPPSSVKFFYFRGSAFKDLKLYRSVVGSLKYLTVTRSKLAYCVGKVSQFMQNPLDEHWKLVKRVLRYMQGTLNFGLDLYKTSVQHVKVYNDSDWGGDPDDRKSTDGFCVFLGSNLISWSSKK